MTEIMLQRVGKALHPVSTDDAEALSEFKPNQISVWKCIEKGVKKQRSYRQFNLFHAALRVVVANTEDQNWRTVDRAKLSLKVSLGYIDTGSAVVGPDGEVVLNYRSFAFKSLSHMAANKIFDRSWPILANVIGVDADTIIEMAKRGDY